MSLMARRISSRLLKVSATGSSSMILSPFSGSRVLKRSNLRVSPVERIPRLSHHDEKNCRADQCDEHKNGCAE